VADSADVVLVLLVGFRAREESVEVARNLQIFAKSDEMAID
jgi:hypothetical protein